MLACLSMEAAQRCLHAATSWESYKYIQSKMTTELTTSVTRTKGSLDQDGENYKKQSGDASMNDERLTR